MPKKYKTLNVPIELVEFFEKLAEKDDKPTKWSQRTLAALYGYRAMHRARGIVD